jgi:SPP1 gp7 family putative phage head morphogenesis protein
MVDKRKIDVLTLGKTANGRIIAKALTHALYAEGMSSKHQREVTRYLARFTNKLRGEIADTLRFYESMYGAIGPQHWTNIKRTLAPHFEAYAKGFTETGRFSLRKLNEYAADEITWQGVSIQSALPAGIELPFIRPEVSSIQNLIENTPLHRELLPEQWRGLGKKASRRVNLAVKRGLFDGRSHREIAREIFEAAKKNKHHARTLARTGYKHAMNTARIASYEANSDIIKGWQFLATLDSRTTMTCIDLDGEVFPQGQGYANVPPLHFNCRSDTAPVLKSWKELGFNMKDTTKEQRAALGGPVEGIVPYKEWIKVQPLKTKQLTFGKDLGLQVHQGKISVNKAVKMKKKPASFTYGKAGAVKKSL